MAFRIFGGGSAKGPGDASAPEGVQVYAIGDSHGCVDLMTALHQAISRMPRTRPRRARSPSTWGITWTGGRIRARFSTS